MVTKISPPDPDGFAHAACQPWACFDSTSYHRSERQAEGTALPSVPLVTWQWGKNNGRSCSSEGAHSSSAHSSLAKASHMAKLDGYGAGSTTLCRKAPGKVCNECF